MKLSSVLKKNIYVLVLLMSFSISCQEQSEIVEKDLEGIWVDIKNEKKEELRGIEISKLDSGLYENSIRAIKTNSNGEVSFTVSTDGCFINLIKMKNEKQKLRYLCLVSESENAVSLQGKKLVIGNTVYWKYNP